MAERMHVIPLNDLIEHDSNTFDECPCGPDVEYLEGGGCIVVHHSLDGREFFEEGSTEEAPPGLTAPINTPTYE